MNMRAGSISDRIRLATIAFGAAAAVMTASNAVAWEKHTTGRQVVQDWKRPKHQPTHNLKDVIENDTLIKKKAVRVPSPLLCKNGRWVRECEARGKGKPGDLFGPCLKWTRHWKCNLQVVR